MRNAGFRMRKVIEDLLQYSRISKHEQMQIEDISVKPLIDEVLDDIEVKLVESRAKVRVGECAPLRGNRSQLKHLFQNLITNSIKFARKDAPPEIDITCREAGDEIEVQVRDNGIGFDEKYLDKIFKPFQRLHGREEYEGTGIGLSIVQKIVQNHGGHITAQSRPGMGATFIVTLPLRQARGL
jgi:signal transduction histidine kinase